ncbi:hypothetical protein [Mesorhizobium sp.]|uniref:hypothetical protein n=1 Tax=Mesorhizobium sp. TaxID=1871066 RepID=UPI000FE81D7B|nr:hypothetical protein [Mesorhizobium sp.]RWD70289.1 MAG: hypothetical protein EOS37_15330 [Mesorhizobium sp.]
MAAIINFVDARDRLRPDAVPQMKPQTQTAPRADTAVTAEQVADAGMLMLVRLGGLRMSGYGGGVDSRKAVKKPARMADIERELDAAGIPRKAAARAAKLLRIRRCADGEMVELPEDWHKHPDTVDDDLIELCMGMIGMGRARPELE